MDPAKIDVNVHPTKTEVKFDEERLVYNYLRVSVKHALGRYIVSPTLDFDTDTNFINAHSNDGHGGKENPDLYKYRSGPSDLQKENLKSWENIYDNLDSNQASVPSQEQLIFESEANRENQPSQDREPYQLHSSYIVSHIKSGYLLIDQQLAHQRIVYERNIQAFAGNPLSIQKELFPINIEFDPKKAEIVRALLPYINKIGFDVGEFGKNGFVIHGTPSGMPPSSNINSILEDLIDQYNQNVELQISIEENLARSYALISSIKKGKYLNKEEMKKLIDDLFACETPFSSPVGRKTFMTVDVDDIRKYFE